MEEVQPQTPLMKTEISSIGYGRVQSDDLTKWQLSVNDTIKQWYNRILGLKYDVKKEEWVRIDKPIINQDGASWLLSQLEPEMDRSKTLSEFDKDEIRVMVTEFESYISKILCCNARQWEIKPTLIPSLRGSIGRMVYSNYKRALDAGERGALRPTETRTETYRPEEPRKPNIWQKIAKMGGN